MPLALLLVLALLAPAAADASRVPGPENGREVMFVANAEGGSVSIVDARTFAVLKEINVLPDGPDAQLGEDDPFTALARQGVIEEAGGRNYAQDQDVSPDGRTLYVSRGHRADVAAFDIASGRLLWKVAIPGFRADHMTLSEDGRRLYVSALTENYVLVVDTANKVIAGSFPTGQWPHDNHLSADGSRIFNASIGTIVAPEESRAAMPPAPYQLTVARTDDLAVERTYAFDRGIRPIVIPRDEKRMFAQLSNLHGLIEFDLVGGRETRRLDLPVDPGVTEADWDFEAPHHGLAISGDEKTLCAAGRASDYVALVDAGELRPVAIIEVPDAPGWAATTPDGRFCFVPSTRADSLSVISYAGRHEVKRLKLGDGPKQVEPARLPAAAIAPRLVRRCVGRGRLRVEIRGGDVRSAEFRFGERRVARDGRAPFVRTIGRRAVRRTRAKRLVAVVRTGRGRVVLHRPLPRCGVRRR